MKTRHRSWHLESAQPRRVATFLADAYLDYKAARVLLRAGMPLQGAQLASTSVEKHIKAVLAFNGNESHGHLRTAHWNAYKAFDPEFAAALPSGLIELLARCYELRYSESVAEDFNVVIAARELLAWLDVLAMRVQLGFASAKRGQAEMRLIHLDIENCDEHLVSDNIALSKAKEQSVDISAFVYARPQLVVDIRYRKATGLLNVPYITQERPLDSSLSRTGLAPVEDQPQAFRLSHTGQLVRPTLKATT